MGICTENQSIFPFFIFFPPTRACEEFLFTFFPSDMEEKPLSARVGIRELPYSLRSEDPKFEFRCTHPRTNWDHNNAVPCGARRHCFLEASWKCIVVLFSCPGIGATNLNSKGPTNFIS